MEIKSETGNGKSEGAVHSVSINHDFEFTGKAGEFFRIWIVNILLTIVTLGIYSAWAKVRTNRYFYSSTRVAGSTFSYLANPVTILKGRLIGLAFMLMFSLSAQFNPLLYAGLGLLFMIAMPWVLSKALAFSARMSAWRNVRFSFDGSYWGMLVHFILLPVVIALTMGLALPWVIKRQKHYLASHYRFGEERFEPSFTTWDFYKLYLAAFGILCLAGLAVLIPVAGLFLAPLLYMVAAAFVMAGQTNLVYGKSLLAGFRFESNQKALPLTLLYLTNLIAIVFTLGLATPWAMIRLARYRASCMVLVADESLDRFTDRAQEEQSALGEELGDVFDVSVGI